MKTTQTDLAAQPESATAQNFLNEHGAINHQAIVQHNKAVIIAAMRSFGLTSVVASYEGGGDEGGFTGVTSSPDEPDDTEAMNSKVTYKTVIHTFDKESGYWPSSVVDLTASLEIVVENFTDALLALHGHESYENGDGGGGTVTIDAESETVTHDHYDNVVETVSSSHSL